MSLADLDELILKCRHLEARECIREAVLSYKSGAYRSAVVSTWLSVAFDYIQKLYELEASGNANAKLEREQLETICKNSDLRGAQAFEQKLLQNAAEKYQILSPIQRSDLERLLLDRHQCAHPSLHSLTERYEPTAELARVHIRNAVEHLLSREPIQTVHAISRVMAQVESPLFPGKVDDAVSVLGPGLLRNASEALARNVATALLRAITETAKMDFDVRTRMYVALLAVQEMHPACATRAMELDFKRIPSRYDDEHLSRIAGVFAVIPHAWHNAESALRTRSLRCIETIDDARAANICQALARRGLSICCEEMGKCLLLRSDNIGSRRDRVAAYSNLFRAGWRDALSRAIDSFEKSDSWQSSNGMAASVLSLVPSMSDDEVKRVLEAVAKNDQLYRSFSIIVDFVPEMLELTKERFSALRSEWQRIHDCFESHEIAGTAEFRTSLDALLQNPN